LGCRMVTADERLCNALINSPLRAHVLWIEDFEGTRQ
jgi:predicted nucleic acid-binding protein